MKKGLTEKELAMAMLLPVSTLAYRLSTLPDKIKREICRQGHSISDMEPIWY
jgi:hypothetical protein